MNWAPHIITIFLAAFTGWFTIRLAVKLLFHPRKPVKILGFTLQGVVPKNQLRAAEQLGRLVSEELFSFDALEQKVTAPENLEALKPQIEAHIDHFLHHKLKEVFPMLSMLIGEKTISQMKNAFLSELEVLFPALMKGYMTKLREELDLQKIVTEKITALSVDTLETMLIKSARKQLNQLALMGAAIGLLTGIIQVLVNIYF